MIIKVTATTTNKKRQQGGRQLRFSFTYQV